ncbi:hypothetical protein MTO96_019152 [Rhipicephalus appendiculatus]
MMTTQLRRSDVGCRGGVTKYPLREMILPSAGLAAERVGMEKVGFRGAWKEEGASLQGGRRGGGRRAEQGEPSPPPLPSQVLSRRGLRRRASREEACRTEKGPRVGTASRTVAE